MMSRIKFAGLAAFVASLFLYAGTARAQQGPKVLARGSVAIEGPCRGRTLHPLDRRFAR